MDEITISLTMDELASTIKDCQKCELYNTRTKSVPGEGSYSSPVMFVGEAPGRDEDLQGRPFVGRAGQLLSKILQSVDIKREDIFITNIVKCRPPDNRDPKEEEMETCLPYLESQIALINPRIIVTLGSVPTKYLLNREESITRIRGQWLLWTGGIKIFPMFHPSYLLRYNQATPGSPKVLTWRDIKELKRELDSLKENRENSKY